MHHHIAISATYLATALILAAHGDVTHATTALAIAWVYAIGTHR